MQAKKLIFIPLLCMSLIYQKQYAYAACNIECKQSVNVTNRIGTRGTIYERFTDKELDELFRVVEAEATAGGFVEKSNVAFVIFNRLDNKDFGYTLGEILVKDQFSSISDGRWENIEITNDTKDACEYAYISDDTTGGALYFHSNAETIKFCGAIFLFQDGIKHNFYK